MKRVVQFLSAVLCLLLIVAMTTTICSANNDKPWSLSAGLAGIGSRHGGNSIGINAGFDNGRSGIVNSASLTLRNDTRHKVTMTVGHTWDITPKWEGYVGGGVAWSSHRSTKLAAEAGVKYAIGESIFLAGNVIHTFGECSETTEMVGVGIRF